MKAQPPNDIYNALYPQEDFPFDWHMLPAERCGFEKILSVANPEVSIEIGTFRGGGLPLLSKHSNKLYSIDIDSSVKEKLSPHFEAVDFRTGNSKNLIPEVLSEIESNNLNLNFVLIDGAHEADGVRSDIELILKYRPKAPLYILLHDSFNPDCRKGMQSADWAANPHVQFVEFDFVCGQVIANETLSTYGEMWGGLALAGLYPEERTGEIRFTQQHALNFESCPHWISESHRRLGS